MSPKSIARLVRKIVERTVKAYCTRRRLPGWWAARRRIERMSAR